MKDILRVNKVDFFYEEQIILGASDRIKSEKKFQKELIFDTSIKLWQGSLDKILSLHKV